MRSAAAGSHSFAERFLRRLHEKGLHTTLNLHPAEGIAAHEDAYPDMAKAMGVDSDQEETVACDVADPKFLDAYFTCLHHPLERQGVDFWWIDWQQGTRTKIEGLDPLWVLNHFHYLDSQKNGKRGMMFSRYAGPGSHRYPIGFSGDTVITWDSLDFQPYFTATAANIGYGWWSHDIGGHMLGAKDDELETRWYQFGIYSPIMRLHSTASEFNGKEPWRFKKEAGLAMEAALRERHRMLPYLYTMNYRAYQEDLPIVLPLYYRYPEEPEAYQRKNQYFFGSELMVAAVTSPRIPHLNVSRVTAWLPDGLWYDIHTGMIYRGDRTMNLFRSLDQIPVLAKAGAILPYTEEISGRQAGQNPGSLRIKVYAGDRGSFTLYEDDNTSLNYQKGDCVTTAFTYEEKAGRDGDGTGEAVLILSPAVGNRTLIPQKRSFTVELNGFTAPAAETAVVTVDDTPLASDQFRVSYDSEKQAVVIGLPELPVTAKIMAAVDVGHRAVGNDRAGRCFAFLNQAEIPFAEKDMLYQLINSGKNVYQLLSEMCAKNIGEDLYGALTEILTAMEW